MFSVHQALRGITGALDRFIRGEKNFHRGVFSHKITRQSQRIYRTPDAKRSIIPWARTDTIAEQKGFRSQPLEIALSCWKRVEAMVLIYPASILRILLSVPGVGHSGGCSKCETDPWALQRRTRNSKEIPWIEINRRAPWEAAGEGSPGELIYNPASTDEAFLKSTATSLAVRGGLCRVLEVSRVLRIS